MSPRRRPCRAAAVLLAALLTGPATAAPGAALGARGIGPLQLGAPLQAAAAQALPLDPAAALVGPGCDSRDQVTIRVRSASVDFEVMAMARDDGRIDEVIALPQPASAQAADAPACRARVADLAARLAPALGQSRRESHERKPVSEEFQFHFPGAARAVARWFPGGRSCDLALVFNLP